MSTVIVSAVIVAVCALAVYSLHKDKKNGKTCSGCGGNCSGCHGGCHTEQS